MRSYKVDVPVRVMIWTRPECQRRQFEVLREAAPSIMFLISDGGRNEEEKKLIAKSRAIFDEIDWDCKVYKLYFEENQGMYGLTADKDLIWSTVDRCIFLEDDYVPAVSYFQFCAEMLEKYKDDERIQMICGHNPFGVYDDAKPYDYFFSENGWSIWGTACWKRTMKHREFPLEYRDNKYIQRSLKDNLNYFWYNKVKDYSNGKLNDNHIPGTEYYYGVNGALYHQLAIITTKNMINNIGMQGAHFDIKKGKEPSYMNCETYEIDFPIKHPNYIIDDKYYGKMYDKLLGHVKPNKVKQILYAPIRVIRAIFEGRLISGIKKRLHKEIEK